MEVRTYHNRWLPDGSRNDCGVKTSQV